MPAAIQAIAYHVYTAPNTPTGWMPSAWLAIGLGLGITLLLRRPRPLGALLYILFAILVGIAMVRFGKGWDSSVGNMHARMERIAADPATPVVEGRVRDFSPAPEEGHADETFTVGGVHFSYSDYVITGGFNQSRSHGGPIHEGVYVRIHYVPGSNLIAKLELADSGQVLPN